MLEALSTGGNLAYLQLYPIKGKFDFKHLKDIHRFIFQDVFSWAGKVRDIDIGKGNLFCRAQFIEDYAISVFADFYSSCYESRKDEYADLQGKLTSKLLILSEDDADSELEKRLFGKN